MGKGQKACVMSGIYCAQVACTDDILVGLDSAGECLCVEQTACLALNFGDVKKPVGMIPQDGFFCKLGLFCCTYGCKKPTVCCAGSGKACCVVEQAAFPIAEPYITTPVCAVCFLACLPSVGCMIEPPNALQGAKAPEPAAPAAPAGAVTDMSR